MKVKELIDKVNSSESCYSIYDAEKLIKDNIIEKVASNLDITEYKYHFTSINVYKVNDGYIGIWGISHLKNDKMTYKDCNEYMCIAKEYELVYKPTYVPKV